MIAGQRNLPALDALRALAALTVFIAHLRGFSLPAFGSLPETERTRLVALFYIVTRPGHAAVLIFFVLSGFLVGGQVIGHVRQARFSFRRYFIDRASRIYIPLVPSIIFSALIGWYLGLAQSPGEVAAHLVGLNGVIFETMSANRPLWSLAYEIWFYVLAGACAYLVSARRLRPEALVAFLAGIAVFTILDPSYLAFWLLGAVSAWLKARNPVTFAGAIVFVLGAVLTELVSEGGPWFGKFSPAVADAVMCIGLVFLLPGLRGNWVNGILKMVQRPVGFLSNMSYTRYVFHYPIILLLSEKLMSRSKGFEDGVGIMTAKGLIVFIGCVAAYFCFEHWTPFVRRKLQSLRPGPEAQA